MLNCLMCELDGMNLYIKFVVFVCLFVCMFVCLSKKKLSKINLA